MRDEEEFFTPEAIAALKDGSYVAPVGHFPEWTYRGGWFRSEYPEPWKRRNGRWSVSGAKPFGWCSIDEYKIWYDCPRCQHQLWPDQEPFTFVCIGCSAQFLFSFGTLYEPTYSDKGRYEVGD